MREEFSSQPLTTRSFPVSEFQISSKSRLAKISIFLYGAFVVQKAPPRAWNQKIVGSYGLGKSGFLCAYRWDEEAVSGKTKFVIAGK